MTIKFTNRYGLPKYLEDWLKADDYDHNSDEFTLSATTLMKPIRANILTKRYTDELEMDVSDLISSKVGNSIHNSIEQINTPNVNKEQRTTKKITIGDVTYTISGKYDILVMEDHQVTIRDIKTTSVWTFIHGGKDEDYQRQLSIYRWLLSDEYTVNPIAYIDFVFTDWQSAKAKIDKDYPPLRIKAGYPIKLMSLEEVESYIISRVKDFHTYKNVEDNDLPKCTKEELWATDDTFAVMKPGAKRALRVLDSHKEARAYISENALTGANIQIREGKAKRCKYCAAAPFCSQFSELLQQDQVDQW